MILPKSSPVKSPPPSAPVSDLMDAATAVFRATLAKSLPIAMFAILFALLPNMYWMTTGRAMDLLHPPTEPTFWVLSLLGFALYQALAGMLMLRQRAIAAGGAPEFQIELAGAVARWPMLILTAVLAGLAVFVGTFALVIPGVFLLVCFLLLRPVVLFETADPIQALIRCVRLVQPIWVKVLAAAVIALLVFAVCVLAAGACLQLAQAAFGMMGVPSPASAAIAAACALGIQAIALVYLNSLWLVLYSAASSSA